MMRGASVRASIAAKWPAWDEAASALIDATRALASDDGANEGTMALLLNELHDTLREVAGLRPVIRGRAP